MPETVTISSPMLNFLGWQSEVDGDRKAQRLRPSRLFRGRHSLRFFFGSTPPRKSGNKGGLLTETANSAQAITRLRPAALAR